ncbi:MAG: hypothetical protein KUG65_02440 [Sphingomonadaceae bacterium]|nr:hypothetical protein [Sphingomonadaceae bacterium]
MALKVIGAGLGRTGTLSLKLALEHLGYGPCYHMLEIMSEGRERLPQWMDVVHGSPNWDAIFDGFGSTVDYPACNYWRELADHYPKAKVILSTRDAQDWFKSVNRTIMSPENVSKYAEGPLGEFMAGTVLRDFGDRSNDQEFMQDYFRRWEASLIEALPPERLLIHRPGDGWEPLCAFLQVPVPDEPYPRVNTTEDMKDKKVSKKVTASPKDAENGARGYIDAMRQKAFDN